MKRGTVLNIVIIPPTTVYSQLERAMSLMFAEIVLEIVFILEYWGTLVEF
jgi:hypothetical protein